MWQHCWQNLFYKLLTLLCFGIGVNSFSQDKTFEIPSTGISYPGLFETFEILAKNDRLILEREFNNYQKVIL